MPMGTGFYQKFRLTEDVSDVEGGKEAIEQGKAKSVEKGKKRGR